MLKKYVSLVLVGLMVVHLAGFYVYFVVRLGDLRRAKRESLAQLPTGQLEVISIPTKQFKSSWLEEREMEFKGKMYDIARIKNLGDHVLVFCLHDKDEDDLLKFMSAVVDMSTQDNRQAPGSVVQFFSLKFVVAGILLPAMKLVSYKFEQSPGVVIAYHVIRDPMSPPPRPLS